MGNVDMPLVGERYREIADEIIGAAGSYSDSGLVVISGPSGSGKTRIVREVYANPIARQIEPRYCPPLSDLVRSALEECRFAGDPVVRTYSRYLYRLEAVWEGVSRIRRDGPLRLEPEYQRSLRKEGAFSTVALADGLWDHP